MKHIKLTKGKSTLIDDEDFEWLNQYKWYCSVKGYAARNVAQDGKKITMRMHQAIMGKQNDKLEIDHKNGNKLDNRRDNLRICSHAENSKNRKILDPISDRYFFIENPKKIKIKNAPHTEALAPLHPEHPEKGFRKIKTGNEFYIQDELEKDKIYRFMHLFNFKNHEFISKDVDSRLSAKMIHWLPVAKDLVKMEVIMPNAKIKKGLGEPILRNKKYLKVGDIIQFIRFGFCRLDKRDDKKLTFYYTHD